MCVFIYLTIDICSFGSIYIFTAHSNETVVFPILSRSPQNIYIVYKCIPVCSSANHLITVMFDQAYSLCKHMHNY